MTSHYTRNNGTRVVLILLAVFIAGYAVTLTTFGLHRPCWHDECHFVETIRLFISDPSLSTLRHYNEMSTPLPFILYAAWGTVFGDSLVSLRLLSVIIAVITICAYFYFFLKELGRPTAALFLTVFLALNPYMAGASIFVFTDMLAMLFLVLLCFAIRNRSPGLSFVASAAGLLCRQYFLFVVIASVAYCVWCFFLQKKRRDVFTAAGLAAGIIPLVALFFLWKGFCPVNEYRMRYMNDAFVFHPNSVTLYGLQLFVYMLPVIYCFWKPLYLNRRRLIIALVASCSYWIFPVAVSAPGVAAGKFTVGYFHRLLRIWPGESMEHIVFFICFMFALPIFISIISDTWRRLISRETDFTLFLDFLIISFFIIMPFSYLHWEKYFLPMVPIVALQLWTSPRTSIQKPVSQQT